MDKNIKQQVALYILGCGNSDEAWSPQVKNAAAMSRNFKKVLDQSNPSLKDVALAAKERTMSAIEFNNATGKKWPF